MGCLRTNYRSYEQIRNLAQKYSTTMGVDCVTFQGIDGRWHFLEASGREYEQIGSGKVKEFIHPL